MTNPNNEVGFFRRIFASLIDMAIVILFIFIISDYSITNSIQLKVLILDLALKAPYMMPDTKIILLLSMICLYPFFCWIVFGSTLGEKLMKMRIVSKNHSVFQIKDILKRICVYVICIFALTTIFTIISDSKFLTSYIYNSFCHSKSSVGSSMCIMFIALLITSTFQILIFFSFHITKISQGNRISLIDKLSNTICQHRSHIGTANSLKY